MTTATLSHRAASRTRGSYGFRTVAQMEWQKLRTVRSTWYIVAIFAVGMIGLAMLVLSWPLALFCLALAVILGMFNRRFTARRRDLATRRDRRAGKQQGHGRLLQLAGAQLYR